MKKTLFYVAVSVLSFGSVLASAQSISTPTVDNAVVERIKTEAFENSHIMDYASWLTDVYGPRLTNTPQLLRAQNYVMGVFNELGLVNVHLHKWGPFGTGWELKRFAVHANSPYAYFPVIAYPKAWSPGYDEMQSGEVVYLDIRTPADYEKYRVNLPVSL
jgi:carboxypeptidase Q